MTHHEKVQLLDRNSEISPTRQTSLLDISRSSIYYIPKVNEEDIAIMHIIDKIYTKCPFYGSRKIKDELVETYLIPIGRGRTQRLMQEMGIEAIYPKKKLNLSKKCPLHTIYPYLLRNLKINVPNQVWGTDITYVKLGNNFAYLTAILDWYSRYVIAWELSETMESDFCISNLTKALEVNAPEIHNSDQGSQFTAKNYIEILKNKRIDISMDGRGRCMDNIFTERLWRTVKYENVYLKSYQNFKEAKEGLREYFHFYNTERRHDSLEKKTPEFVYYNSQKANVKSLIIN